MMKHVNLNHDRRTFLQAAGRTADERRHGHADARERH